LTFEPIMASKKSYVGPFYNVLFSVTAAILECLDQIQCRLSIIQDIFLSKFDSKCVLVSEGED